MGFQRREIFQGLPAAVQTGLRKKARTVVFGGGQLEIARIGIGASLGEPGFRSRFQNGVHAVGSKRAVGRDQSARPPNDKGIHQVCIAEPEVDIEGTRTAVALTAVDFIVAHQSIKVRFNARTNGRTIGGCSLQFKHRIMPRLIQIFEHLEPRLCGRSCGGNRQIEVSIAVEVTSGQTIIAVVMFKHGIALADPGESRITQSAVQAVRCGGKRIVIDDVQVGF